MTAALRSPFAEDFSADDAAQLAAALKVLADPNRLRIISVLARYGEMAGVELLNELDHITQPTMSHHLRILDEAGLITSRKVGWENMRTLDRDALAALAKLLRPGGSR